MDDTTSILVVSDQPELRRFLEEIFRREGVRASFVTTSPEGLLLLEQGAFRALFADLDMPSVNDEFVRCAVSIQPRLSVILLGQPDALRSAPERIRVAGVEYLVKPLVASSVRSVIASTKARISARGRVRDVTGMAIDSGGGVSKRPVSAGPRLIAKSAAMRGILDLVPKIARSEIAVLIQGEAGVGKTSVAREIHQLSPRASGPFVRVACGALRDSEVDAKLFGPCGQDFRGDATPSLLESSEGGTLFLSDVSHLPLWAQVRLLNIIQQGRNRSPEESGPLPSVRLIASTIVDLETLVAEGRFCAGLYYFLTAVRLSIPALRYRQEDIRAITEHLLATAGSPRGMPGSSTPWHFSEETWQYLLHYDWPGNVLQLAGVVAHAVALADGAEIGHACIADSLHRPHHCDDSERIAVPLAGGLKEMERTIIEHVIQRCRGNKAAAARILGLHRRTLYRLLEEEKPTGGKHGTPQVLLGTVGS